MLDPPFLELQYYVQPNAMEAAVRLLGQGVALPLSGTVALPGAVGLLTKPEEFEVLRNVIILRTEGEAFCGPRNPPKRARERAFELGRLVQQRFVAVADALPCPYGAILVEYSLEEPRELERDPRSLAFRDFFLGGEFFNPRAIAEIRRIAGKRAYVEQRARGVYISMSAEFNPDGKEVSPDALERSARISVVVGNEMRLFVQQRERDLP